MSRHDALFFRPDSRSDGRTPLADLHVRKIRIEDAEALTDILSDPAIHPQLLQMPYGDVSLWRGRLTEMCAPGKPDLLLVAVDAGDTLVGFAGLHPVCASPRRRHAMSLGISVRPEWQGCGVGAQLMQSLCDYADRWLGLLRLELEVYADNLRAQLLYRRFGFVEEGRHCCDTLRDGVYVDSVTMARLNPTPLRGFAPQRLQAEPA